LKLFLTSLVFQDDGISDLIAGVTVGLTIIPQGIAYALVANLPAQVSQTLWTEGAHFSSRKSTRKSLHILKIFSELFTRLCNIGPITTHKTGVWS
jgi:hypothetical protein